MSRTVLCLFLALNFLLGPMTAVLSPPYYKCFAIQTVDVVSHRDVGNGQTGQSSCEVCVRVKVFAYRCNYYESQDKFVVINDAMDLSKVLTVNQVSEFLHVDNQSCESLLKSQRYGNIDEFGIHPASSSFFYDLGVALQKERSEKMAREKAQETGPQAVQQMFEMQTEQSGGGGEALPGGSADHANEGTGGVAPVQNNFETTPTPTNIAVVSTPQNDQQQPITPLSTTGGDNAGPQSIIAGVDNVQQIASINQGATPVDNQQGIDKAVTTPDTTATDQQQVGDGGQQEVAPTDLQQADTTGQEQGGTDTPGPQQDDVADQQQVVPDDQQQGGPPDQQQDGVADQQQGDTAVIQQGDDTPQQQGVDANQQQGEPDEVTQPAEKNDVAPDTSEATQPQNDQSEPAIQGGDQSQTDQNPPDGGEETGGQGQPDGTTTDNGQPQEAVQTGADGNSSGDANEPAQQGEGAEQQAQDGTDQSAIQQAAGDGAGGPGQQDGVTPTGQEDQPQGGDETVQDNPPVGNDGAADQQGDAQEGTQGQDAPNQGAGEQPNGTNPEPTGSQPTDGQPTDGQPADPNNLNPEQTDTTNPTAPEDEKPNGPDATPANPENPESSDPNNPVADQGPTPNPNAGDQPNPNPEEPTKGDEAAPEKSGAEGQPTEEEKQPAEDKPKELEQAGDQSGEQPPENSSRARLMKRLLLSDPTPVSQPLPFFSPKAPKRLSTTPRHLVSDYQQYTGWKAHKSTGLFWLRHYMIIFPKPTAGKMRLDLVSSAYNPVTFFGGKPTCAYRDFVFQNLLLKLTIQSNRMVV